MNYVPLVVANLVVAIALHRRGLLFSLNGFRFLVVLLAEDRAWPLLR
jgi:hypothetical protein